MRQQPFDAIENRFAHRCVNVGCRHQIVSWPVLCVGRVQVVSRGTIARLSPRNQRARGLTGATRAAKSKRSDLPRALGTASE